MDNFTFCSPTFFQFGKDAENQTASLVKKFGGSKILLHYGSGSVKKSGLYDRVKENLTCGGIAFVELGGVEPNPKDTLVREGIKTCRENGVDFVLAMGGGSVIDSAKAIAAGTLYDGDFWDFYSGKEIETALPIGTILTISAAGSEGSANSVITKTSTNSKIGAHGESLRPKFSILNPELTETLPPFQTAAGATDIMIHICERYFSVTPDCEITDRLCEAVLRTIITQAPLAVKNPQDYSARANIMWAGMIAHNNLCGVGREQDWVSHHMEHELSAFYEATHGAGLAVIAPAWMEYVSKINPDKFVQFAVRVWDCENDETNPAKTAAEGISRFRAFLNKIGMPSKFSEVGGREEDIPKLASHIVGLTDERTYGGYVKLNRDDIEKIYRLAL